MRTVAAIALSLLSLILSAVALLTVADPTGAWKYTNAVADMQE